MAAALCAGTLAGCGANSNSENAAASGAEDTVTLAVVSPVTGGSAEYGIHFNIGAQMAADKINEAGGINGKQVVLKSFDSKNDAKEADFEEVKEQIKAEALKQKQDKAYSDKVNELKAKYIQ